MTSEADLQVQVADYLRLQYPDVMFHSDFGSGIKLTMGQAIKQKRQNGGRRAWPDMFIAHPTWRTPRHYCGLFIELKKEGTRILKKDGTLVADEHIREQWEILGALTLRGYRAEFACGFDEAKKIIDEYLRG
jgi:hypothetical protein